MSKTTLFDETQVSLLEKINPNLLENLNQFIDTYTFARGLVPVRYLPGLTIPDTLLSIASGVVDIYHSNKSNRGRYKKIAIAIENMIVNVGTDVMGFSLVAAGVVMPAMTKKAATCLLFPLAALFYAGSFGNDFLIEVLNLHKQRKKLNPEFLMQDRLIKFENIRKKIKKLRETELAEVEQSKKTKMQAEITALQAHAKRLLSQALNLYRYEYHHFNKTNIGLKRTIKQPDNTEKNLVEHIQFLQSDNDNTISLDEKLFIAEIQSIAKTMDTRLPEEEKTVIEYLKTKQRHKIKDTTFRAVMYGSAAIALTILAFSPFIPALLPFAPLGFSLLTIVAAGFLIFPTLMGSSKLIYAGYDHFFGESKQARKVVEIEMETLKAVEPEPAIQQTNAPLHTLHEHFENLYYKKHITFNRAESEFEVYLNTLRQSHGEEILQQILDYYDVGRKQPVNNNINDIVNALRQKFKKDAHWQPDYSLILKIIETYKNKNIQSTYIAWLNQLPQKELNALLTYYELSPEKLNDGTYLSTAERQCLYELYLEKHTGKCPQDYINEIKKLNGSQFKKHITPYLKKMAEDNIILKHLSLTADPAVQKSEKDKQILQQMSDTDKKNLLRQYGATQKLFTPPTQKPATKQKPKKPEPHAS